MRRGPDGPGRESALIYSSDQGTYDTQHECALMMGWEPERIHVVNALVGGGFGGKEDVSVQHHALPLGLPHPAGR